MRNPVVAFAAAALFLAALSIPSSPLAAKPPASGEYHVVKTVSVPGDDGWDYLAVDSEARRVYISHGTHVVVMNADTYAIVGDIPDTQGVHGIALASEFNRGFTSNGRANTVTVFDLKTLKVLDTVKTGANPDAIVYDPATKRVFTMNGRGQDTTAINAADGSVAGSLALGGKPEFAVSDGKGSIFVNIEDKSEIVQFDAQKLTLTNRWPLAPCEEPSGLAIDRKSRRLFSGCDNKVMAIVNADTGKVIDTPAIGEGVDATAFDPETHLAFSSNGKDGTLTVVREESPDKFVIVENAPTKKSARTMGLDLKTHKIFLSSADFDPPAAGERRPKVRPGTFAILVVSQ